MAKQPRLRRGMEGRRLVSIESLAAYIDSTPGSIRVQMSKGILPFEWIKSGRKVLFDLEDVDAWIEGLPRYGGVSGDGQS